MKFLSLASIFCMLTFHCISQGMKWECHFNNTKYDIGTTIETMKMRGYAPTRLQVAMDDYEPKFTSLWKKHESENWAIWHSMNEEAFINKLKEFEKQGLSPVDIAVWKENNGNILFAAIWKKIPFQSTIELNIPASQMQETITYYANLGFSLVDINGIVTHQGTFYTCLFNNEHQGTLRIAFGKTESQFQKEFDQNTPLGYYPIDINFFNDNGVIKCNGIWVATNQIWDSRHSFNYDQLSNYIKNKEANEFEPILLNQYYKNGGFQYGATMVKKKKVDLTYQPQYQVGDVTLPTTKLSYILNIPPVMQQTKVWCWLATGEMLFRYYGLPNKNPGGNFQCGIIGTISGNSVCAQNCFTSTCIIPSGSNANTIKMLKDYTKLAANKTFICNENYELNFAQIKKNIDQGKPILCGISPSRKLYYSDAEHAVVLIGYEIAQPNIYLIINDPFPYSNYDNPYTKAGGIVLKPYQYKIDLRTFTNTLFWHWSLSNINFS